MTFLWCFKGGTFGTETEFLDIAVVLKTPKFFVILGLERSAEVVLTRCCFHPY